MGAHGRRRAPEGVDADQARARLHSALAVAAAATADARVEALINAPLKSVRYAALTQILAKATNPRLTTLALQVDPADPASFDPREFCKQVVLPFERAQLALCLGASGDPYVSKPLRRPRLRAAPQRVRGAEHWAALYRLLAALDRAPAEVVEAALVAAVGACLRRAAAQPDRAALTLPHDAQSRDRLTRAVGSFLGSARSGGRRLQATVSAVYAAQAAHGVWASAASGHVNTADAAGRRLGDIELTDPDGGRVAVEVKDRPLTLSDLHSALDKLPAGQPVDLIVVVRGTALLAAEDRDAVGELLDAVETAGRSVTLLGFDALLAVALCAARARRAFLGAMQAAVDAEDLYGWQIALTAP